MMNHIHATEGVDTNVSDIKHNVTSQRDIGWALEFIPLYPQTPL